MLKLSFFLATMSCGYSFVTDANSNTGNICSQLKACKTEAIYGVTRYLCEEMSQQINFTQTESKRLEDLNRELRLQLVEYRKSDEMGYLGAASLAAFNESLRGLGAYIQGRAERCLGDIDFVFHSHLNSWSHLSTYMSEGADEECLLADVNIHLHFQQFSQTVRNTCVQHQTKSNRLVRNLGSE